MGSVFLTLRLATCLYVTQTSNEQTETLSILSWTKSCYYYVREKMNVADRSSKKDYPEINIMRVTEVAERLTEKRFRL